MDSVRGFALTQIELATADRAECDGIECHVITGSGPHGAVYEIFVGRDDLLLRQINRWDGRLMTLEEHRRDIRVDEPIENSRFVEPLAR